MRKILKEDIAHIYILLYNLFVFVSDNRSGASRGGKSEHSHAQAWSPVAGNARLEQSKRCEQ